MLTLSLNHGAYGRAFRHRLQTCTTVLLQQNISMLNDSTAFLHSLKHNTPHVHRRLHHPPHDQALCLSSASMKRGHSPPSTPARQQVQTRACERSGTRCKWGAERAKYSRSAERVLIQGQSDGWVSLQFYSDTALHESRACTNPHRLTCAFKGFHTSEVVS